ATAPPPAPKAGTARRRSPTGERGPRLDERHEVVLADPLQHQKCGRVGAAVRHEMRPARGDAIALAGREAHFLLRLAQEDAQAAGQHLERIADAAVVMPRHMLRWRELELGA